LATADLAGMARRFRLDRAKVDDHAVVRDCHAIRHPQV
jgi:hypothetical protein